MANVKDKFLLSSLRSGALKNKRRSLIKVVKLENYLKYCKNVTRLLEAIAYAQVYPIERREGELYEIAINACDFTKEKWGYHCIIQTNPAHSISSLEDILIVNFQVFFTQEREALFIKYPFLKQSLSTEIARLWKRL